MTPSLPQLPRLLDSAAATLSMGQEFAAVAKPGQVIALVGDLGAGKTTLTQGLIKALGYHEEVTSPTFSLVQEYHGNGGSDATLDVFHFDFYRVEEAHELLDLGWDDYLERGGLTIVEWPTLFPELLPTETLWLQLTHQENGRRIEQITAPAL